MTRSSTARKLPQFLSDEHVEALARDSSPSIVAKAAREGRLEGEAILSFAVIDGKAKKDNIPPEDYATIADAFEVWEMSGKIFNVLGGSRPESCTFKQLGQVLQMELETSPSFQLNGWRRAMVQAVAEELATSHSNIERVKYLLGMVKLVLIDEGQLKSDGMPLVTKFDLGNLKVQMNRAATLCPGRFGDAMRHCASRLGDEIDHDLLKKDRSKQRRRLPRY